MVSDVIYGAMAIYRTHRHPKKLLIFGQPLWIKSTTTDDLNLKTSQKMSTTTVQFDARGYRKSHLSPRTHILRPTVFQ